ncbi:MAG: MarR family winged helix-turn-helix transcriptional regulator [Croceibacterium sp.]
MAKARPADRRNDEHGIGPAPARSNAWREQLVEHAAALWRHSAGGGPAPLPPRLPVLGQMAEEAVSMVETFTLGALARAKRGGSAPPALPEEFRLQLGLILNGLEPSVHDDGESEDHAPPLIFQSELWQVLHKMRESAELSYAREVDLVEIDRRILFLLRSKGALVPAELSGAVGVDKAQVSRSVKRLLELRMVEREQIRSPVALTRKGEHLADRLLRLADLRNRELIFDIADDELEQFFAAIEILLKRSVMLYEQERASSGSQGRANAEPGSLTLADRKGDEPILLDRARIMSPLLTLSAYFSRSGALAFKRRTGLSNFEAWVLNEIGRAAPIDWPTLTAALQRDHSQAGRTVKALLDRGLIDREGRPGRRHGRFYPSPEGQRLFDIIQETSVERSGFLMAPLGEEQRARFLATFDKLRRNAEAQLEREKAFEELDRA